MDVVYMIFKVGSTLRSPITQTLNLKKRLIIAAEEGY